MFEKLVDIDTKRFAILFVQFSQLIHIQFPSLFKEPCHLHIEVDVGGDGCIRAEWHMETDWGSSKWELGLLQVGLYFDIKPNDSLAQLKAHMVAKRY